MGKRTKKPSAEAYVVMVYAHPRLGRTRRQVFYRKLGPMAYGMAVESARRWTARSFTCKVRLDRTQYWAEYHKERFATDPKYIERKRANARKWDQAKRREVSP